ncbi:dipeptidase PepV [Calidifontibacillus erzurumensis]|uniref:Dipeptidase PepV n=1 Tax=Calidifontibacillus erzurumensis TaxID=2741433 RepID=A0A8J8KAY2_9BACI|nr:dipeptidase PepV [Calidifontibacillus erzurumensis]NSL51339.1 dipeptidase PepV [Calidifontibacillus erzurumensis]
MNWLEEVYKRKNQIIKDTQEFLRIKSVLDEDNGEKDAPLGRGIKEALHFMLNKGANDGFTVKNVDNLAGHIEYGQGKQLIGVLCHVDVVPEGDGWTSDPFGAEIRDGKIFARGAIDDKGPTMAAYYALKIVKELQLPLSKRVRIILGTDEESQWCCVKHYFKHEEMPTFGFVPDADFPIINAEKGIFDFFFEQNNVGSQTGDEELQLESFQAGRRLNMVPDLAEAQIVCKQKEIAQKLVDRFSKYVKEIGLKGKAEIDVSSTLHFRLHGISAHGMEPNNGKNAGLLLNAFFEKECMNLDKKGRTFIEFVHHYFGKDTRGLALGIADKDEISGELTINNGILSYKKEEGGKIGLNLRYPVTHNIEVTKEKLKDIACKNEFRFIELDDSKPHHVDGAHPFIKVLQNVYEEETGQKANLLAIGGGTYARSLESGVAFGPLFPGREDVAHQKDEYIEIDDLLKATAIYARAIYELAK